MLSEYAFRMLSEYDNQISKSEYVVGIFYPNTLSELVAIISESTLLSFKYETRSITNQNMSAAAIEVADI